MDAFDKCLFFLVTFSASAFLSLGFYSIHSETQIEQQKLAKHYSCLQILDSFDKN